MLDKHLLVELQVYIERNLNILTYSMMESNEIHSIEIEDFIKNKRQPTFNQTLFKLIDKKGAGDTETYKKAGLDRRHFSKIRSNPEYRPRKNTVVALALALELNKKETDKLLSSAGYSLSDSETFDLVIQFCLEKKIYDVHDVNQALDYFRLKPLIGVLE
ncbi:MULTISPECIES: hypothetical protein [Neobacillus]|uniref:Appr-1-p processing protein n=1 Tax=Neobacillus citreus TaxID=2833578 RepID=A0A942T681_9BACI|nr:hypothetical protein [Neobacillus citreus]MCH6267347.1 hypothetical protein [Neobacillus citreus]